jgi:Fe-S cluster assembly iron-binding protein IscA
LALALDEPKENDTTYVADGITYMIEKELSDRIGTVKVDYTESGWRSGFTVSSEKPISTGPSTCGSSCSC